MPCFLLKLFYNVVNKKAKPSHCLLPQTHQWGPHSFLELLSLGSMTSDPQSTLAQEAGQVCKVLFTM